MIAGLHTYLQCKLYVIWFEDFYFFPTAVKVKYFALNFLELYFAFFTISMHASVILVVWVIIVSQYFCYFFDVISSNFSWLNIVALRIKLFIIGFL